MNMKKCDDVLYVMMHRSQEEMTPMKGGIAVKEYMKEGVMMKTKRGMMTSKAEPDHDKCFSLVA